MAQTIMAVILFIIRLINAKMDGDAERKKKKLEALNEVKEGLKARDRSRITAGFGRLDRL